MSDAPAASAVAFLAVPAAGALVLLVVHARANRGARATLAFGAAVAVYGLLRGLGVRWITERVLGAPFPYRMRRPLVTLAGVSLQEVVGWALATLLAWTLADRLLRRLRLEPAPHRTAVAAAVVMATICLAVESAAVTAGWWSWTIPSPPDAWVPVPRVAYLDWSFVAFDFLLPYLLVVARAALVDRVVALALFPLHLAGHTLVTPAPDPWLLAGSDVVHGGIVAYVLARATGERGRSPLAPDGVERRRWCPTAAAGIVIGSTALATLLAGGGRAAAAALPLLALTLAAGREPRAAGERRAGSGRARPRRLATRRVVAVVATLTVVYAVRAPANRAERAFVAALQEGATQLNDGDAAGAEEVLRAAVAMRPDQGAARALLALALLGQGRRDEARRHLETVLARAPDDRDALMLLAAMDLQEGRRAEAGARAARGRAAHPGRAEFVYLAAVAAETAGPAKPPAQAAVGVARRGGAAALQSLARLARTLGDEATAQACRSGS